MSLILLKPLTLGYLVATSTVAELGKINRYNSTDGSVTATLPPLSGALEFQYLAIEKTDSTANTVSVVTDPETVDTVQGSASLVLKYPGETRYFQVFASGGSLLWKVVQSPFDLGQLDQILAKSTLKPVPNTTGLYGLPL